MSLYDLSPKASAVDVVNFYLNFLQKQLLNVSSIAW